MPGFGDLAENALLDCALRGVPYPYTAGNRLGLHSADPGDTGSFELAGLSYARQSCAWNAPSGGVSTLAGDVDFNGLPAGTVGWFSVWTSAGVFTGSGIIPSQTINNGGSVRVLAGTTFSLT